MAYLALFIILIGLLIFYLKGRQNKPAAHAYKHSQDTTNVEHHQTEDNAYQGLRDMAFTTTPEQLDLKEPDDKTIVYGIIMDIGMDGGVATIVSYQTGDASLYTSTGGGIIGGGKHENVSKAAKQFIGLAQAYLDKATKTKMTTLPGKDVVKFYLLTNHGIYIGEGEIQQFDDNSSNWTPMFNEGNKVITELRQISGQ